MRVATAREHQMLTHEDSEIVDGLGTTETVGAFRRQRVLSHERDARLMRELSGISDSRSRPPTSGETQWFDHFGRMVCMKDLAAETGIPLMTLYQRWHRGDRNIRLVRPMKKTGGV